MTKKESDKKQRQGKRMYINDFSLDEIAEILEVHIDTIKRWAKKDGWEDARAIHSISIAEIKRETLQCFADMKAGKSPKISPDQLSKIAATFEKLSDKKKALAYMYENFDALSDAILQDAMSERLKKDKEEKLKIAKYVRSTMDNLVSQTYKDALNE